MDNNGDGKLSKEELLIGFTELEGDAELALVKTEAILKEVDINNSYYVDFHRKKMKK